MVKKERIHPIIDKINDGDQYNQIDPEALISLYAGAGEERKAALFAYDCAVKAIESHKLRTAMKHLKTALSFLSKIPGNRDSDKVFIAASLVLSDVVQSLRHWFEYPINFLHTAMEAAQRIGDERDIAMINLHLGRIYFFLNSYDKAMDAFKTGMGIVNRLGDEDILSQSSQLLGVYYFMQGMNLQAAEHFERVMSAPIYQERQLLDLGIPIFIGNSAALMGHFYRAVGVLDSNWRRAQLISDHLAARFLRADLGNILLMAGKKKEAISHLETAQEEALVHNDTFTVVQARRGLAYHHFLEGRIKESYQLLKATLFEATRSGQPKPVYHLPWILEMLFAFHNEGLEPIKEWDFKKEIDIALKGINLNLRGVALRIKAKLAEKSDEDSIKIRTLLENSEADLERSGAIVELAKTRAELARRALQGGEKKEAVNFALKAWEGLSIYGFELFPDELKPLIKNQSGLSSLKSQGQEILDRYMAVMMDFVPSADRDELLVRLLTVTSRFFEAERAGIFWFEIVKKRQLPSLRPAYCLTHEEAASDSFSQNRAHIFKAFNSNKPITAQVFLSSQGGDVKHEIYTTLLCLPFDVGNLGKGVLYYDNKYLKGGFESLNKSILAKIAKNVEKYIRWINEYCSQIEEKSRLVIGQITKSDFEGREFKSQDPAMLDLLARADQAAKYDAPVLILGESGVGKELIARRIHEMSLRRHMSFIAVNLSSVPETLVESQLFGHEKGSFTGADRKKLGSLELADNGTFFIDEVGDISKSIQLKILRALEEKSFYRVGGTLNVKSDFRLIAATNRDLSKEIASGNFREDLFYRLNVVPLTVPPLRKRRDDVLYLADYFLNRYAKKYNRPVPILTDRNESWLKTYHWPGNVRELKNVIERLMILSTGEKLEFDMLEMSCQSIDEEAGLKSDPFSDNPTMDELQRRYIEFILKKTNGKLSGPDGAAKILGMKRTTLHTRMKKLGLK